MSQLHEDLQVYFDIIRAYADASDENNNNFDNKGESDNKEPKPPTINQLHKNFVDFLDKFFKSKNDVEFEFHISQFNVQDFFKKNIDTLDGIIHLEKKESNISSFKLLKDTLEILSAINQRLDQKYRQYPAKVFSLKELSADAKANKFTIPELVKLISKSPKVISLLRALDHMMNNPDAFLAALYDEFPDDMESVTTYISLAENSGFYGDNLTPIQELLYGQVEWISYFTQKEPRGLDNFLNNVTFKQPLRALIDAVELANQSNYQFIISVLSQSYAQLTSGILLLASLVTLTLIAASVITLPVAVTVSIAAAGFFSATAFTAGLPKKMADKNNEAYLAESAGKDLKDLLKKGKNGEAAYPIAEAIAYRQ